MKVDRPRRRQILFLLWRRLARLEMFFPVFFPHPDGKNKEAFVHVIRSCHPAFIPPCGMTSVNAEELGGDIDPFLATELVDATAVAAAADDDVDEKNASAEHSR